jgi:hypothetical protein
MNGSAESAKPIHIARSQEESFTRKNIERAII